MRKSKHIDPVDKPEQLLILHKEKEEKYCMTFSHLLDFALWNSYILQCQPGSSRSIEQFRMKLFVKLIC